MSPNKADTRVGELLSLSTHIISGQDTTPIIAPAISSLPSRRQSPFSIGRSAMISGGTSVGDQVRDHGRSDICSIFSPSEFYCFQSNNKIGRETPNFTDAAEMPAQLDTLSTYSKTESELLFSMTAKSLQ